MDFLPAEDKEPISSNYMKLKEGDNKIRILSNAVIGWVYWEDDGDNRKPVRVRKEVDVPEKYLMQANQKERAKYFWSFVVYNYAAAKIQILELTQKTIREQIRSYNEDSDWGDPKDYDLKIERDEKTEKTKYNVKPSPKKKFAVDLIVQSKNIKSIDLDAMFEGKDPFSSADNSEATK